MCYGMMQFCKIRNTHTHTHTHTCTHAHTEKVDPESVRDAGTDFCASLWGRHSIYLTH